MIGNEKTENYLQSIRNIFPQEIDTYTLHEGGDDFVILEVNQSWMFRFPRNSASSAAMKIETNFLSEFGPVSPLPVPARNYISDGFVGYRKIQGEQLSFALFANLSKSARARVAQQLGNFLSALHNFPVEKAANIGIAHAWNGLHHQTGRYFLEHVAPKLSSTARKNSVPLMESLLAEEFEGKIIHGDFYLPDHVFYNEGKQELSGVIDFGDVTIYDPAHDWQCVVETGSEAFFEAVMEHYQAGANADLLKRSKMRLDARPLFVAGYIFLHGLEEQYAVRLARIEVKFG